MDDERRRFAFCCAFLLCIGGPQVSLSFLSQQSEPGLMLGSCCYNTRRRDRAVFPRGIAMGLGWHTAGAARSRADQKKRASRESPPPQNRSPPVAAIAARPKGCSSFNGEGRIRTCEHCCTGFLKRGGEDGVYVKRRRGDWRLDCVQRHTHSIDARPIFVVHQENWFKAGPITTTGLHLIAPKRAGFDPGLAKVRFMNVPSSYPFAIINWLHPAPSSSSSSSPPPPPRRSPPRTRAPAP